MAPRWRPTLQPAGFGPGVAGKGPAFGGHLASGLPVLGTMRCDAIPPGLTVAAPLRWTMDW